MKKLVDGWIIMSKAHGLTLWELHLRDGKLEVFLDKEIAKAYLVHLEKLYTEMVWRVRGVTLK